MIIKFIISLLVIVPYIYLKSKKSLHMLQQNWYNDGNRYLKWINNNKRKVFFNIDILLTGKGAGGKKSKYMYYTFL